MNELIQVLKKRPELRKQIASAMAEDQVEAFYDKSITEDELKVYQEFWYAMQGWKMNEKTGMIEDAE